MKRYKHSFYSLSVLYFIVTRSYAEELTLNINFRQPISVTDEKFLSLTLDPAALFHGDVLSTDFERSVSLAKALSPAYVRLGGAHGTFYQSIDQDHQDNEENRYHILTESKWIAAHHWAEKAGLNIIACIAPEYIAKELESSDSLEDAGNIVSFSNHMGFNTSWQLGYECQTRCNISATDLARQLVTLRKMLNEFPRYSNSLVVGPDVVDYRTDNHKQYLRDYFSVAAPALSAITWHPDFDSVILEDEGVLIRDDTLDKDKEELFKVIGRFSKKKPLWIAESKPEECKNLYLGALVLTRRLGSAAKLKVNVVMRQPSNLTQPTPDYWVSLLHKTLVGREVFDTRVQSLDKSHVYFYCQCTRASNKYQRGSVTIFGVNLSPENVRIDLKGAKITTLHQYILSPGFDASNRMFAESVLLNNVSLTMVNDTVPDLEPEILNDSEGLDLNLQSGDIGFWVLPELQIKACMEPRESSEMQNSRNSARVPQSLRKKVEDTNSRVTRSTRDRGNARSVKRKEENNSRVIRKPDVRRELKRLRRFVKRKLNDYDAKKSLAEGSSNTKQENRSVRRSMHVDEQPQPQDNIQAKLQDFKTRLSRSVHLDKIGEEMTTVEDPISEVATQAISLISKMQDTLEMIKGDYVNSQSSDTTKNYLQLLYELLTDTDSTEVTDTPESEEEIQRSKRAKRDLSTILSEPGFNLKRKSLLRGQVQRREDNRIQPHTVQVGAGDSGERTFYGFFKTDPVEGFPEGDVFFTAEDHPRNNDYRYQRHELDPVLPYDNPKEDYDEYYESSENTGNPEQLSARVVPSELWEKGLYERQRNPRSDDEDSEVAETQSNENQESQDEKSHLRQLAGYYAYSFPEDELSERFKLKHSRSVIKPVRVRRIPAGRIKLHEQRSKMWDYDGAPIPQDLTSEIGVYESRRHRRGNPDLHEILDQEMVKEDDANSKDCKCRVIRSKRQAPEPVEHNTNIETVSMEAATADPVPEVLDSQDLSDVEVFSEVEGAPMEILQLQTEPSSMKLERNADTPLQSEPSLDLEEIEPPNSDDFSPDTPSNSAENPENTDSSRLPRDPSSMVMTTQKYWEPPLTSSSLDESTFFRDESRNSKEESATINTFEASATYTSNSQQNFTTSEAVAEAGENTEEIEVSRAETSGATLDSATLSEKSIAEGTENDYNNDKTTGGGFKRHAENEAASQEPALRVKGVEALSASDPKQSRNWRIPSKRPVSNKVKPWERRLFENTKTLVAMRRMLDQKKNEAMERAARLRQPPKNSDSLSRLEQIQQLREKLRNRRQKLLQRTLSRKEAEENAEDEETRNLRRREAQGMIKDDDDRESTYVMMYEEPEYEERGDDTIDESMEKRDVPVTEVVRARNVRERIFNPKHLSNFQDQAIIERSDPTELTEVIELKNLFEKEDTKSERSSEDTKEKSYLALVEDLENPRIFHYRKSREEQKRSLQMPSRFHASEYNPSRYGPYENLEIIEDSNENEEESGEQSGSKEIYIIDPSNYRGGEPTLQLYRSPLKLRRTNQKVIVNGYESAWTPTLYKSYRVRETEPCKREYTERRVPQQNNDEAKRLTMLEDLSKDLYISELLRILINSLDVQSLEELLKRLPGQSAASIEKQNFVRSISEESGEEQSREDSGQAREEDKLNPEEWRAPEVSNTRVKGKRESYKDPSMGTEVQGKGDTTFEAQITPKDSAGNSEGNFDEEGEMRIRRRRDTGDKFREDYSIRLRDDPEVTSDEDSSKVFKILKQTEFFKAVPVKDTKTSKNLRKRFLPLKRHNDNFEKRRDFSTQPEPLIPLELNKYSSIQEDDDPMVGVKQSQIKLSMNYQDISDSLKDKSKVKINEGLYNKNDKKEGSEEHENKKKLLHSDQPEVLMVLPWAKRLDRHRRQTNDQEKVDVNIEKVQHTELQELEDASTSRIPTYIDDVEKSIAQKRPLEMHTKDENLANYINEKKRLSKSSNKNHGFSSLIEENIPKLQNAVIDGLEKAQNITSSVERLIEDVDEKFDETSKGDEQENFDSDSTGATQNAFYNAILNVKKIFMLLGGITHILYN
ncbi:uncharacterized protein LOC143183384 [Calliopsis andreniformis]|uniref:uncharacterized protein LOC143183384 n=1 Tax=Calliopsis andreniformis TaxID=337506 RepID=UPI003FCCD1D6